MYWTYDTAYRCHVAVSLQCGPVQAGELKGISPYHILFDYTFNFNLLGLIFYTPIYEEDETVVVNATVAMDVFLGLIVGSKLNC